MSSQIQNKLFQYAPEPPQKVWVAIENVLDERTSPLLEKLYQFEELPPADVWKNINKQLDGAPTAKVVPFFRRYQKAVRYSTAAAVLIFLAVTTMLLIGNKTEPEGVSRQAAVNGEKGASNPALFKQNNPPNKDALLANAEETKTRSENSFSDEKKTILNRLRPHLKLGSVIIGDAFIPKVAEEKQTVDSNVPVEKYMVYSDGDGNAMKLSKKLFDFISCVNEDVNCKQEMEQLQQKFASTAFTTDFTGILEALKNLKENQ